MPKTESRAAPPPPVLRVTPYEQVSSGLIATLAALVVIVSMLSFAWFATRVPRLPPAIPVELVENPGGVEDGSPDETLRIDSPLPEITDATVADVVADEPEVAQSLDNVTASADDVATQDLAGEDLPVQSDRPPGLGTRDQGKPGSASGTGRRALGSGSGLRGFPREQRWYVRFIDQQDLAEYARQLDFFGIELGAIVGGKLVYVSKLSAAQPVVRTTDSGAGEKRLYMTWQGGGRKQADLQLLTKSGVNVGNGAILHFYPKATEDQLARIELDYRKRRADEIRRTYFAVNRAATGYEFAVVQQIYLK